MKTAGLRLSQESRRLQIKDSEKEIYVKEGKILKAGLFKGRVITRPPKHDLLSRFLDIPS